MTTRNKSEWQLRSPGTVSPELQRLVGGHPLTAQILAARGFTAPEVVCAFLTPEAYTPAPPDALPDLVAAAERLNAAIAAQETILVWGDFDVDGQTATSLLVDGLRGLGAAVEFYIPHRLRESHGIRLDSLKVQLERTRASVLLTCDTGISAHTSIDYAKSQGVATLITDHHDLPPELPRADAAVDPKRLPADHPLAALPGVGVAYKLIQYLYTQRDRTAELPRFLDLVALGIVADVATQTHDTRYLLQLGMNELRRTARTGLQALFALAELNPAHLTTEDIAFQIGPRLNAAGRMDDANPVVELFTTTDETRAHILALQLEGLNNQRRLQNRQIYAAAQELIARDPSLLDWEALVLAHPHWHAGIIGIVASHLAEQVQRPVVLLTLDEEGHARGSARSVPGYDIGAGIAAQADLLDEFGGHPGAAGLALPADNIPAFRRRLSDTLRATRAPAAHTGIIIDAEVSLADLTLDLAQDLQRLAPFGEGNPPVTLLTRDLDLLRTAMLGRTREHRRLTVEDTAKNRRSILWWNSADKPLPDSACDIAYQIGTSTYNDDLELQLTLVDYRRAASAPAPDLHTALEIVDRRGVPAPEDELNALTATYPGALIWAEGYRQADSPGLPLHELHPAPVLIIYTVPTGPVALQNALKRTQPGTVVLLAINPPLQTVSSILRRVLELTKYVINNQGGRTTLEMLASAVGHSEKTILFALQYAAARGEIEIEQGRGDALTLSAGTGTVLSHCDELQEALHASIAETAAYRAFFQRADPAHVLGELSSS